MFVKSKISHDVINTSWCQKVRKDVKNTSWWQKVRYYFKKFVITSKSVKTLPWRQQVCHEIRKFFMTSKTFCHEIKNTSWCQKVCHEVKTCHDVRKFVRKFVIMMSKRKTSIMTLKSQKEKKSASWYHKVRQDVTKFVMMTIGSSLL